MKQTSFAKRRNAWMERFRSFRRRNNEKFSCIAGNGFLISAILNLYSLACRESIFLGGLGRGESIWFVSYVGFGTLAFFLLIWPNRRSLSFLGYILIWGSVVAFYALWSVLVEPFPYCL